jgi:radical SAM superfamily enzyme YgiQ (UPF0313 family)
MTDIVLATLNARYIHAAFGLRYLKANMGSLESQTALLEFVINDHPAETLTKLLEQDPKIIGFGVYIWNVEPTLKVVADIKRLRPEICIVLGGPEVSYETAGQAIVELADYVITGEADRTFPDFCQRYLNGQTPSEKIIISPIPELSQIQLPYHLYSTDDIAHRVLYVEVSRGCPFTCEFCLSSLEIPVRLFDLPAFLQAMQRLLDAGAKQFKFVDRTFNLNLRVSQAILQFFLDRYQPGLFLHFEMIPDRLPESLRSLIAAFPAGAIQLEIGVQSFDDQVNQRIRRKQDVAQLEANFRFLREATGVHIHADLIVGLPGENLETFAIGFDRLFALRPQEIQVGMLKRLRGTPIVRHDEEWSMVYSPHPPYEILSTKHMSFETIQSLRRFARYWDLIGNSGNFSETLKLVCVPGRSAFERLYRLSQRLYQQQPQLYGISLVRLTELIHQYLLAEGEHSAETIRAALSGDYTRQVKRELPNFLKNSEHSVSNATIESVKLPERQRRHLKT